MRLGAGRLLCDDESLPLGRAHAEGEFDLRDEVVTIDVRQSLSPLQEGPWKVVPGTL